MREKDTRKFRNTIRTYYKRHGRDLPWRKTKDPYKIAVSEIMLQQTQVSRVLMKYPEFIKAFPSFEKLERASLISVLKAWQGMGYNRRAISLKGLARKVIRDHRGKLPKESEYLLSLPGIGRGTAGSLRAFAFNLPAVFIETNIRRVFIDFFFNGSSSVADAEILPLVEATLDRKNPREWYWALMDYGSMLGRSVKNPNRKSAHYRPQPAFKGSNREARGNILKLLLRTDGPGLKEIQKVCGPKREILRHSLEELSREGFIRKERGRYYLAQ